jgi:hypothetical protein
MSGRKILYAVVLSHLKPQDNGSQPNGNPPL